MIKLNKLMVDTVDKSVEWKPDKMIKGKCDEIGAIPFDGLKKRG